MFEEFYGFLESFGYTHPIHPTQINMPIAFAVAALIVALGALFSRKAQLLRAARYAAAFALIFLFPTAIAGFMDWQHFYAGAWLPEIKVKIALAVLFFFLLVLAAVLARKKETVSAGLLMLYATTFVTAVALGYFGGEIVFGNSAPQAPPRFGAGESVFRGNCSGCHPFGGNILSPRVPLIASRPLGSQSSFIGWIRAPRDPMPEFGPEEIPDGQAETLYAYLAFLWSKDLQGKSRENGQKEPEHAGAYPEQEKGRSAESSGNRIKAHIGMTNSLKFQPEHVTITAGESVRWENSSGIDHTVTADPAKAAVSSHVLLPEGAARFDSGNMRPGDTFTHRFEVPGLYRYFCIPHEMSGMVGEIEVK